MFVFVLFRLFLLLLLLLFVAFSFVVGPVIVVAGVVSGSGQLCHLAATNFENKLQRFLVRLVLVV